jgi:putative hemolysin
MIKFKEFLEEVKKPTGKLKDACWTGYTAVGMKMKGGRKVPNCVPEEVQQVDEVAAWQRKEGKSESGGLNKKGIASYRRENPGSKLSMAVTTKPSKLKKGSKAANRRKSFCARMGGMKKRLTSAKTAHDPDSRINKALRKWNC